MRSCFALSVAAVQDTPLLPYYTEKATKVLEFMDLVVTDESAIDLTVESRAASSVNDQGLTSILNLFFLVQSSVDQGNNITDDAFNTAFSEAAAHMKSCVLLKAMMEKFNWSDEDSKFAGLTRSGLHEHMERVLTIKSFAIQDHTSS